MVDTTIFMAAERNGHSGQIFEALRNRFPEIPEQVISRTLQTEVLLSFVISVSSFLWRICRTVSCCLFLVQGDLIQLILLCSNASFLYSFRFFERGLYCCGGVV